ncbi:hypothetical protein GCM10011328_36940 [Hafnia psychrotolerans]|uniref:Uncharacterized protein n=1 Tax=Hafnia psychrotolerans TaxID=1477018 RepID=A0ABQ1H5A8_9GAMM|nr:hypothetical protein GCM10011328_36940 [Hafnia psychrotolerans]
MAFIFHKGHHHCAVISRVYVLHCVGSCLLSSEYNEVLILFSFILAMLASDCQTSRNNTQQAMTLLCSYAEKSHSIAQLDTLFGQ